MDDLISRQAVKEWLERWEGYLDKDMIARMQLKVADIPTHPTPSNTLGALDCISRKQAIEALCREECGFDRKGCKVGTCYDVEIIEDVPSAQPPWNPDEWCHDCKEYDKEKHCCPRWNRVIRNALEEAKPRKGKWIDDGTEFGCCCSECGSTLDDYFDGLTEDVRLMKIPDFCLNCGADMRGDLHEGSD